MDRNKNNGRMIRAGATAALAYVEAANDSMTLAFTNAAIPAECDYAIGLAVDAIRQARASIAYARRYVEHYSPDGKALAIASSRLERAATFAIASSRLERAGGGAGLRQAAGLFTGGPTCRALDRARDLLLSLSGEALT